MPSTTPTRGWTCLLLGLLALFGASDLSAQDQCSGTSNLVANCGFEVGDPPSEWEVLAGSDFVRGMPPYSGSYSGQIAPEPGVIMGFYSASLEAACFAVAPAGPHRAGFSARRWAGSGSCRVVLESYSDSACQQMAGRSLGAWVSVAAGDWTLVDSLETLEAPFASLVLECQPVDRPEESFLLDSVFARQASAVAVSALSSRALLLLGAVLAVVGWLAIRRRNAFGPSEAASTCSSALRHPSVERTPR